MNRLKYAGFTRAILTVKNVYRRDRLDVQAIDIANRSNGEFLYNTHK